jgi:hypothetical protein
MCNVEMSGKYFENCGGGLDFFLCQIMLQSLFLIAHTYVGTYYLHEVHCGKIQLDSYGFRSIPCFRFTHRSVHAFLSSSMRATCHAHVFGSVNLQCTNHSAPCARSCRPLLLAFRHNILSSNHQFLVVPLGER